MFLEFDRGEEACVDLNNQEGNNTINNEKVKELLENGESWSNMWLKYGQSTYPYDENFMLVSNYSINNKIANKKEKSI